MIVTEEQAFDMWCPMSRTPVYKSEGERTVVINRDEMTALEDNRSCCVGPVCMMWRWMDGNFTHGFCGLAGKPQFGDL